MRVASITLTLMATFEFILEGYAVRRRHQRDLSQLNDDLNSILEILPQREETSTPDYFKEYLSRGMFQCTSKYVETITKLHEFIKKAHEEYKDCERRRNLTPKSDENPFESLNKFVEQYETEERIKNGPQKRRPY